MTGQNGFGKRLNGKVAVITGATGGIGEATARRFLDEGACVMLVGRSKEKLKEARERLAVKSNLAEFVASAAPDAQPPSSKTRVSLRAAVVRPQDIVLAGHFEKVEPKVTNHALRCKAHIQHLAFTSDNHQTFSKWPHIMIVIGREED